MSDNDQEYVIPISADVSSIRASLVSVDQDIEHLAERYRRVFNQQVASPQAPAATPQEAVQRARRDLTPSQLQEQSPQAAAMLRELTRLQSRSETLAVRAGLPSASTASSGQAGPGSGASGKPLEITAGQQFLQNLAHANAAAFPLRALQDAAHGNMQGALSNLAPLLGPLLSEGLLGPLAGVAAMVGGAVVVSD